jgi:multidrug efflux pump subunit AcrA (membrane-fusion protein)
MLVEVAVPNEDGALFPGSFVEVTLDGSRPDPALVLPAAAIVFRSDGPQVAVVHADGAVHLQKVTIGRDYGDRVEILQGIQEGATVLAVPGDTVDGARVVPVEQESP